MDEREVRRLPDEVLRAMNWMRSAESFVADGLRLREDGRFCPSAADPRGTPGHTTA